MRPFHYGPLRFTAAALTLLALGACGGELTTPGEALRILAQSLEPAFIGEPYSATLRVAGGLSPYSYELEGALPPGLELQGNTLRGTPSELGTYTFTVTVSDANLSKTFQEYSLQVIEAPPASLQLNVPITEMERPFMLRGRVEDARDLQAFRSLISWDASRFELVPNSVRAARNGVVLLHHQEAGSLNIDLAVLGEGLTGEHTLFEFALRPLQRSTIEVTARTEFLSSALKHAFAVTQEGIAPEEADDETEDQPDEPGMGEDDD